MSVRHLPRLNPEHWYIIDVDQGSRDGLAPWQERTVALHGPNCEASLAWYLLHKPKRGFGWGFQLGRNGGESDVGLNLYAGRWASVWMRLRAPWLKWARVTQEQDPKSWYYARHTGLRIHPWDGCLISGEFDALDGYHSSDDPWWRSWSITKTTILGRTNVDTAEGDSGVARIPLPEGVYLGTWTEKRYTTRHIRFPGTLLDRVMGPRRHQFTNLDVEGGIPIEGKGENSYDCGMDGLFGCSGTTLEDAAGNAVKHVLKDRQRYGGPHDLQRPMTVMEAGKRHEAST